MAEEEKRANAARSSFDFPTYAVAFAVVAILVAAVYYFPRPPVPEKEIPFNAFVSKLKDAPQVVIAMNVTKAPQALAPLVYNCGANVSFSIGFMNKTALPIVFYQNDQCATPNGSVTTWEGCIALASGKPVLELAYDSENRTAFFDHGALFQGDEAYMRDCIPGVFFS